MKKKNGTKRIFLVSTFFILFLFFPSVTNNQEVFRNSKTNVSSRIFFEIDGGLMHPPFGRINKRVGTE